MMDALATIVVIIPAYQPGDGLPDLVAEVLHFGFKSVVVVNDGSSSGSVFARLKTIDRCEVITHAVNLGKGRALKTGLNHALLHHPDAIGVVTADADGQHRPADIAAVGLTLSKAPDTVVLGSRHFAGTVPLRSLMGNLLTRLALRAVVGLSLTDTQTGLRGIPLRMLGSLMRLEGEQYEYEMNMLLALRQRGTGITEVPIATVYIDGNKSSHFNPFFDSMKIYFVLLRFCLSSVSTSLIDQLVFFAAISSGAGVARSMIIARCVASVANLIFNRSFVFHSTADLRWTVLRYYISVAAVGWVAYTAMQFCIASFAWSTFTAKITVECILFLASFVINREFVFAPGQVRRMPRVA